MNKSIIGGGIVVVLIVALYFFLQGTSLEDLITQKNKLQNDFTVAEKKLNKEKETLGIILTDLRNSSALTAGIVEQTKKASSLVKQTDFLFDDSNGENPELKFRNPLTSILINNERRNINLLIAEWQKKSNFFQIKTIGIKESEQIKKDAQAIKAFLENLSKILASLTPANSGLTQLQIDTFSSQFPSVNQIDEVLTSLGAVIENYNTSRAETYYVWAETRTGGNQNSSDSSPSEIPVTENDITLQQTVVAEMQTQIVAIQAQLQEVEKEIQQKIEDSPTPVAADPITPEPVIVEITPSENQNVYDTNVYATPPPREPITSQGIIIQPGPPRLIQGTDPF